MPVAKQSGAIDCGLYAIAIATALAYSLDPTTLVFRQDLRPHLLHCIEKKKMEPFPIIKSRKAKGPTKLVVIYLCPMCKKGDDKSTKEEVDWVACDTCNTWYHLNCISCFQDEQLRVCQKCSAAL